MKKYELIVPCHFGLEAILKKEIIELGYDISKVEDGRVSFYGDEEAACRANIFIRTGERVLIKIASFNATTYDELFENTKKVEWQEYFPKDAKFWVAKAGSVKSKLFSPSDIQSIMKKAMVEKMKEKYHLDWFEETGESYPIRVFILKDEVTVGLDTTGISLHKRGYRKLTAKAPIAENLAAALIMLTPWNENRILVDPFCGSGTIPIEAAMMAMSIAPGMNRQFSGQNYSNLIDKKEWEYCFEEANDMVIRDLKLDIQAYDLDPEMVRIARENAKLAGVDEMIHFQKRALSDLSHPKKYGFIITNPPYGERLEDKKELPKLYKEIGDRYNNLEDWSMYIISSYEDAEKYIGRKSDKNRKIYNGMLKTYYYQYFGKKPPRK